jgi:hypothetical protein
MRMPEKHTKAQLRMSLKRTLLKRLGGSGEIAKAARFIAESDFMCGSNLVIDGGRKIQPA